MKRFDQYEPDELLAMEQEELDKLIDLECAYRGVALLPNSPTPPVEVAAGPDVTVYNAGGKIFRNEEDAQKVVDLMNSLPYLETYYLAGGYQYSGPQGVKSSEKEHDMEAIRESKYWTEPHYDKHRNALATYKEAKAQYDKDRKEYERILGERDSVANEVAAIRSGAQQELNKIQRVKSEFARYLDIADGDKDQALKFYLHANTENPEEFVREAVGMEPLAICADDLPESE